MNDNNAKEDKAARKRAASEEAARKRASRKEELARKKAAKKEAALRKKADRKAKVEAKRAAKKQKAEARKAGKEAGVVEEMGSQTGAVETTAAAGPGRRARKPTREEKKADRKAKAEAKKAARRARLEERKAAKRQKGPKKEKKPLFGFGKKKKAAEAGTVVMPPGGPPAGRPAEPPAAEAPGEPAKKGRRFGKKGGRAKKPAAAGAKTRKRKGAFGGSKYSPVGLDIGRSSLAAVRLQYQAGGSTLLSAALDQLPDGIISEGEVQDVDALSHALKNFWKSHRIKGKKVALGLASQKVVVRTLDFPVLDSKELRKAIEFQAQDYIPIPIDEAVFDFHVMGRFTDEDGIEKQKVLVVAAQKAMVMDFIDAVKKARLVIDGIDLQAFALLRSFSKASFLDDGAQTGQAMAIVNIASDVTNMIIAANGEPQFTRITSFGGDNFTNAVQQQLGVSFSEAESLKAQIGLPEAGGEGANNKQGPAGPGQPEGTGGEMPPGPSGGPVSPQGGDFLEGPGSGMPGNGGEPGAGPSGPGGGLAGGPETGREFPGGPGAEPPIGPGGPGAPETGGAYPGGPGDPGAEPPIGSGGPGQLGPGGPTQEPEWPESQTVDADQEREIIQSVHRALEVTADSFADDLRRSLDYYSSQEDSLPIGSLVLSGGGSLLPNLETHLASMFPFEVKIGSPLGRISRNKSNLTDEELHALSPRLAIAIGLALEDEE